MNKKEIMERLEILEQKDLFEGCLLGDAAVVQENDIFIGQCAQCREFKYSEDFEDICNKLLQHFRDEHEKVDAMYEPEQDGDNRWILIFDKNNL